jgi:two-component system copper resistance phosphate regulon response regulator CusR
MKRKILLVEDNTDMRESLKTFLSEEGATVYAVGSAEEAIDLVDEKIFDIGIIDINLPGKSGFSLVEYIRENGHVYPLIAMTARDGIIDKIKGFDLGLTDYVVKPFDLLELRARIHAHAKGVNTKVIKTDNFELRPESFEFFTKGVKIDVTQLEMRILEVLLRNNHILVPLDDLIEFAWGEQSDLATPPVRIHIANLRKKIGDHEYQIIRTISGVGYILDDPIAGVGEK